MIRRPPRSTRTDTLCPYTTLFRSACSCERWDCHCRQYLGSIKAGPQAVDLDGAMCTPDCHMRPLGPSVTRTALARISTPRARSEEHTSELQSLMRISYAVFCLKKKNKQLHNK